jgi:hypothetical protein
MPAIARDSSIAGFGIGSSVVMPASFTRVSRSSETAAMRSKSL